MGKNPPANVPICRIGNTRLGHVSAMLSSREFIEPSRCETGHRFRSEIDNTESQRGLKIMELSFAHSSRAMTRSRQVLKLRIVTTGH